MAQGMFIPDMVEEDHAGIAAKHPNRFSLPLLVAPTHDEKPDALNTLRHSLVTVAGPPSSMDDGRCQLLAGHPDCMCGCIRPAGRLR